MTFFGFIKAKLGLSYHRKDINFNPDKLKEGESKKIDWKGKKWIQKRNGNLEYCEIDPKGKPRCKSQNNKEKIKLT